jgi:mgtE-like transporter
VPAAIGMRGNVFGALGSRFGTQIHAGTFRPSRRLRSEFGQNVAGAILSSLAVSAALAVLAKTISGAFGLGKTMSIAQFMVVSVVGAMLASVVVLALTIGVSAFCANRDLDLDNVAAPIVTAAGDMCTLPALFLATYLVHLPVLTPLIAIVCAIAAVIAAVIGYRARDLPAFRRIMVESLPVLALAGIVDILAGVTIENRVESFLAYPALLVLIPPFLEDSGSLGAILAARVSSKLHLGTLAEGRSPYRTVPEDVMLIYVYAVPVFVFLGLTSTIVAHIVNANSPGWLNMLGVSLIAGFLATTASVLVGYYSAVATHRFGLDPDNHGIPLVTSSLDLLGALSLILAIVLLGLS